MLKVLIADDELAELNYLENYIRTHHSQSLELVASCSDGASALKEGLEKKPHIAFLDIQMPAMDGLEVSRQLKKADPSIKIVIVTAYGLFDYAKSAIEIGVSSYLVKPFQSEEFDKLIDGFVEELENSRNGNDRIITSIPVASSSFASPVGKKAYNYMLNHYHERISMEMVADSIGFSVSYVSKCLVRDYGKVFNTLLLEIRCNEAARLLSDGNMTVNEVAEAVGIPDANYFTKCFKSLMGQPPKRYSMLRQNSSGN